ncbi:MAG: nickel-dependent hydrogenase large subunit [Candidatus Paceibacterota bacterium]
MIKNEFIAKIEGHGSLDIDLTKKKAELKVLEGERLFEGILVGRPAKDAPWITARICGVCPIAHNLASLKAVEAAFGIVPNKTTVLLRKLMVASQIIQSHALHLFFLALPDYLGLDSGLELAKKNPGAFKAALTLKGISDEISYVVAGREVHPTTTAVGGFNKIPHKKTLKDLLKKLDKNINSALIAVNVCGKIKYPKYDVDLEFVSQTGGKDYPGYDSAEIISSKGGPTSQILSQIREEVEPPKIGPTSGTSIKNYKDDIQEEIRKNSTAKFSKYKKREVMVGALARLATHQDYLAPVCKKYLKEIDFKNPFYNNFAQAVEILHFYQKAREIIEILLQEEPDLRIISPSNHPPLKGIGAVEAPRGGLYHEIHLNDKGKIIFANIITPTVQNLTSIEKSVQAVLSQSPKISSAEAQRLIEMLIRAYDPCITCAVH